MDWKGKKVLVTGACGFIGSHLVERLVQEGASVRAFVYYNSFNNWGWLDGVPKQVKESLDVVAGDVRDPNSVNAAVEDREYVFHLAALIAIPYSYTAPSSYVQTNVLGTLHVLQAAREKGASRVVHTSTSEVYGTACYVPIDEKHPLQGQSPYSASKIGADMIAESYFRSFGVPVVTLRPFNTYGPRQSARAVIPTIISQALDRPDEIALGALDPVRDLTFVDDTVDGFLKAAETPSLEGEVVNLGVGTGISIRELAETIFSIVGVKPTIRREEIRLRPEKSEVMRLVSDNQKAQKVLGWKPKTPLKKGLETTIEWLSRNRERYKAFLYNV